MALNELLIYKDDFEQDDAQIYQNLLSDDESICLSDSNSSKNKDNRYTGHLKKRVKKEHEKYSEKWKYENDIKNSLKHEVFVNTIREILKTHN